jgi:hypothetical protein
MDITIKTPSTATDKAYRMTWNLDHLVDVDVDAWMKPLPENDTGLYSGTFDGSMFAINTEPLALPERIEFDAIGTILGIIDYPYTDVMWPIMSKRMLKLLQSLGNFPHRTYPVVMIDCEIIGYDEANKPIQPLTENYDYVAVQLLEHLDVFDYENSVYEPYAGRKDILDDVEKIFLQEPEEGFPPLFRVSVSPLVTRLFVSAPAKELLETASIRGIEFYNVEDYF